MNKYEVNARGCWKGTMGCAFCVCVKSASEISEEEKKRIHRPWIDIAYVILLFIIKWGKIITDAKCLTATEQQPMAQVMLIKMHSNTDRANNQIWFYVECCNGCWIKWCSRIGVCVWCFWTVCTVYSLYAKAL